MILVCEEQNGMPLCKRAMHQYMSEHDVAETTVMGFDPDIITIYDDRL